MSAGAVFQEALRALQRLDLPDLARRDVVAVLEAARSGPLSLFYDAGAAAGLSPELVRRRAGAVFLAYCAGQLADDLVDGDCDYLEEPHRTGPTVQYILQNLSVASLLLAELSGDTVRAAAEDLARGAGPQQLEIRAEGFDAPLSRQIAEGIAGLQFVAYLRVLWAGTPLAAGAERIGMRLGVAAHVAADIRTEDPRFTTLSGADRHELVKWALDAAEALREEKLRFVDAVLATAEPTLRSER